jgi:hypothetical protein
MSRLNNPHQQTKALPRSIEQQETGLATLIKSCQPRFLASLLSLFNRPIVVLSLSQALFTISTKDNLRLLDNSWHPIRQKAGFLTLNARNIYHRATCNTDKMMMPFQINLIKSGTRTRIGQHHQAPINQCSNDVINGGARQRSTTQPQCSHQFINRAMTAQLL